MIRFETFNQYGDRLRVARSSYGSVPPWGRVLLGVAAAPGILLLALSAAVFLLSIAALLLLTVPVYLLINRIAGFGRKDPNAVAFRRRSGAKQVQVTVLDS